MSTLFAIQTVIEIVLSVLLIIGFIYEDKVIAFEKALGKCIRIRLRRYLKRKAAQRDESEYLSRKADSSRIACENTAERTRRSTKRELRRYVA